MNTCGIKKSLNIKGRHEKQWRISSNHYNSLKKKWYQCYLLERKENIIFTFDHILIKPPVEAIGAFLCYN